MFFFLLLVKVHVFLHFETYSYSIARTNVQQFHKLIEQFLF